MPEPYDVGILFVHGIGAQQRGDTLLEFGEPLVQSMSDWLGENAVALHGTDIAAGAAGVPAHTYATVIAHEAERRLVVAESWWAETFHPPRYWPMAAWLVSAVPFVVFRAFDHRVGMVTTNERIDKHDFWWPWRHVERVGKNVVSSALVLVASLAIALLGVVAVIPAVRRFILSAQTLLIRYIGDSYALLIGPAGADAMVSRVECDLAWLEERSVKHVVIVAHSQGAEIVRRVLARRAAGSASIASLVTLGQGIAKLRAVGRMYQHRARARWAYALRLIATVVTVAPLVLALWLHWWLAFAFVLTPILAARLITVARDILLAIVQDKEPFEKELAQDIRIGKLQRWRDYFATSDPVPEGQLPLEALGSAYESTQMVNLRSPFFDHTSYWQNAEGFRPAVLEELAGRLGWPFTKVFEDRVLAGQEARARKTRVLVAAAWFFGVVALTVSIVGLLGPAWFDLWDDVGDQVGPVMAWVAGLVNGAVEKWLKRDSGKDAATAACVVIACAAAYTLVMVVWQHFATKRGRRVLSG